MGRNTLTRIQPQYVAGMIDADGCVRISGGTTQYVSITNRYLPVLFKMREQYGGNVRVDRNVYRYEATGKAARALLRDVIPDLEEKGEQARLCLEFSMFPPRSAQRKMIAKRIADLKKICYVSREAL